MFPVPKNNKESVSDSSLLQSGKEHYLCSTSMANLLRHIAEELARPLSANHRILHVPTFYQKKTHLAFIIFQSFRKKRSSYIASLEKRPCTRRLSLVILFEAYYVFSQESVPSMDLRKEEGKATVSHQGTVRGHTATNELGTKRETKYA